MQAAGKDAPLHCNRHVKTSCVCVFVRQKKICGDATTVMQKTVMTDAITCLINPNAGTPISGRAPSKAHRLAGQEGGGVGWRKGKL